MQRLSGIHWMHGAWIRALERRRARVLCRKMLRLYDEARTADSSLTGEPLYEQIIARYKNIDVGQTKQILNRADQSFAQWPLVRNLLFRDVVLYLVLSGSRAENIAAEEPRPDLTAIVYSAIPTEL